MDPRLTELTRWAERVLVEQGRPLSDNWQCHMVSGDASFRRYFRIVDGSASWIGVDAPPDKENSAPFVEVVEAWQPLDVAVPQICSVDLTLGFMLLEDFGDVQYLSELNDASVERLYGLAFDELLKIQRCASLPARPLPAYDRPMLAREMALFQDWFLAELLGVTPDAAAQQALDNMYEQLTVSALAQPQVCVHRDYHSRNLMIRTDEVIGVIDFQDAVMGPVTYDLVSLLRDCYIAWPQDKIDAWVARFWQQKQAELDGASLAQFARWFDLMGMQRHLKAVGIFARLNIRDGKPGYLGDIPRTLGYLLKVGATYPEFAEAVEWIRTVVVPRMHTCCYFDSAQIGRWIDA